MHVTRCVSLLIVVCWCQAASAQDAALKPEKHRDLFFFEAKIRPVLEARCLKCHSGVKRKGGLALDHRDGLLKGGDTGPALVPGKPKESLLLRALRHDGVKMPPDARLPDAVVADFAAWIERGAFDPRDRASTPAPASKKWDDLYRERLTWWSLQPVAKPETPAVRDARWPRTDVDRFILNRLEGRKLEPAPAASRTTLARRLSFALTGLPPQPKDIERFVADTSADAYARYVDALLDSPHYGERWARHWMDVVHYADTHGYEWDVPAKHAWRYRDYLIRAFNADVPFDRFILEQIAGDLIEPRLDGKTGVNEALIGPMALRLGERRHGDNSQVEGVTQETISNIIDTVSKGFLGTTVACAQCHDHKLDAVAQLDYYALAGVFMSSRWGVRNIDAADPNEATLAELRRIKAALRSELARRWTDSASLIKKIEASKTDAAAGAFPESLASFLERLRRSPLTEAEFAKERERRIAANRGSLQLLADFTDADGARGWRWEGFGMKHGLVNEGEFVVADAGPHALAQILPAGRWSHAWSARLAGALRSPLLDEPMDFSVGFAGGGQVAQAFIIDQAFHSERMTFLNQPRLGWLTLKAGSFQTLEGSVDKMERRVYYELATKSLNNYYPPRTEYGGVKESDLADERSWFGATRIYRHAPGKKPLDELARFQPLSKGDGDPATRLADLVLAAVERWRRDSCLADDGLLLDEALRLGWLPNDLPAGSTLARLVDEYRAIEKKLQPDRVIGSVSDWNEGRDARIAMRGVYTELGDEAPRGNIGFLGGPATRKHPEASGRLELAQSIASAKNPLTARVYVNRIWLHLFGEGLVRTPDDFGHLGEPPLQRELLDYLAWRFIEDGWSTKKLIRLLVSSAVWQQSSVPSRSALEDDAENRLWHHVPLRRLEAEAIRDVLLAASGRLDPTLFGPPIDPYRTAEDKAKRLLKGPLDGGGRRSIYLKMTLMEPPRFLALFNQPLPLVTVGKRDVTNVPNQALALLNDPFVLAMAKQWSERVLGDGATSVKERTGRMFTEAFGRAPAAAESVRLASLVSRLAELRGVKTEETLREQVVWQDFAHALFNVKEFIYVP